MAAVQPKPSDTVPLATFLEAKKDAKEVPGLRAKIVELEAAVAAGAKPGEIADDLAAIGKKFGVDEGFMTELSKAVDAKVKAAKDGVEQELGKLTQKEQDDRINTAFTTHFDAAIAAAPEFKGIAKADVIKSLSLLPENANKTFAQIIEDTYGHAVPGKRSIEPTVPGGPKEPAPLDYARAATDNAYYHEIMSDPKLKAEYNQNLAKRLKL